jgi:LPS export ABC transporter protein LptC
MKRLAWLLGLSAVVLVGGVWWWFTGPPRRTNAPASQGLAQPPQGMRMEKFSLRDTQRHQTRWEILADIAEVDAKADLTVIQGVHFTLFSERHGTILVTARRGVIHNQSKHLQVCGDVRLVVNQEFALHTECLEWHAADQALESSSPVTVAMGNLTVRGLGFRGWLAEERFEIRERVLAHWSAS